MAFNDKIIVPENAQCIEAHIHCWLTPDELDAIATYESVFNRRDLMRKVRTKLRLHGTDGIANYLHQQVKCR